jgi:serine/threonine protein kinase
MNESPLSPHLDAWKKAESLFAEARDLPADRRAALLASLSANDPALACVLRNLLEADASADSPVDLPAAAVGLNIERPTPLDRFGAYDIVGVLGEGRSGIVYRARQRSLDRDVALKVLASTFLSGQASRRFATETLALRQLRHPNIVPIFDAGTVAEPGGASRPFIAMELVDGKPITEHCRERRSTLANRLELILQLCAAVAHAHRRGILHRDISPGNILVELDEHGVARTRVIDLGLARFMGSSEHGTLHGHALGTPGFMSPEQSRGDTTAIDTRSDVYSIGALLRTLIERDRDHLDAAETAGDLRLIIDTATRDAVEDRYQTVDSLADDVRRFLDRQPIAARPASASYLLSKYVSRHPIRAAAAVISLIAVAAGFTLIGVWWTRAVAAEREAVKMARLLLHEVVLPQHNQVGHFAHERQLLESIRPTLISFSARNREDQSIQRDVATLLERLGDSCSESMDHRASLVNWEQVLDLRTRIAKQNPDDSAAQAACSIATVRVGDEAGQLGDEDRREKMYLAALEMDERSAARWPSDPGMISNLAYSHERLGALHVRAGRFAEAESSSVRQLELARRIGELEGDSRRALWDVACAWATRAEVLSQVLRDEGAEAARSEAIKAFGELASRYPNDRNVSIRMASILIGALLTGQTTMDGAFQARIVQSQHAVDAIAALDPDFRQLLPMRAAIAWSRARVRVQGHEGTLDLNELDSIREVAWQVASRDPASGDAVTAFGLCIMAKTECLTIVNRSAEAVEALQEASSRLRRLGANSTVDATRFGLDLAAARLEPPRCDSSVLTDLLSRRNERSSTWRESLDLLELLRNANCVDAATSLAEHLSRVIPERFVEARRLLAERTPSS